MSKTKEQKREYYRQYREKNRNRLKEYKHNWYLENKDRLESSKKEYRELHKEERREYDKRRSIEKKEELKKYRKKRYSETKEINSIKSKNRRNTLALYLPWVKKIIKYYEKTDIRRDPKDLNLIQVRCKYCGNWTNPTNGQLKHRFDSIRGIYKDRSHGECHIYCSSSCKKACPSYRKKEYIDGFKPATSREVQPELRKLILKRDKWTCQKCGQTKEENPELELHCHHIDPVVNNPIESADMDNCVTLCKECHQFVHSEIPGCKLGDLIKCGINKKK